MVLAGLFQFQPGFAAQPIDRGIYSVTPFSFKADRGIFSEVLQEHVDPRIVSPLTEPQGTRVPHVIHGRARISHDL
jgi:hypothetical protein